MLTTNDFLLALREFEKLSPSHRLTHKVRHPHPLTLVSSVELKKAYTEYATPCKTFAESQLIKRVIEIKTFYETYNEFARLKIFYERAYNKAWGDYDTAHYELCKAVVGAVLNRVYEKSGDLNILRIWREFKRDIKTERDIKYCIDNAKQYKNGRNANGDKERKCISTDTTLLKGAKMDIYGDGMHLVGAVSEVLKQYERVYDCIKLDKYMTVTRLATDILIDCDEPRYTVEYSTIIQEMFRAVRSEIDGYKHKDSQSLKYAYILLDNGLYQRLSKYYGADKESDLEEDEYIILSLKLSESQLKILCYRLRGFGYKLIAKKLGVKVETVRVQLKRVQQKYAELYGESQPERLKAIINGVKQTDTESLTEPLTEPHKEPHTESYIDSIIKLHKDSQSLREPQRDTRSVADIYNTLEQRLKEKQRAYQEIWRAREKKSK